MSAASLLSAGTTFGRLTSVWCVASVAAALATVPVVVWMRLAARVVRPVAAALATLAVPSVSCASRVAPASHGVCPCSCLHASVIDALPSSVLLCPLQQGAGRSQVSTSHFAQSIVTIAFTFCPAECLQEGSRATGQAQAGEHSVHGVCWLRQLHGLRCWLCATP